MPVRTVWSLALNNQITQPPAYDATRAYFSIEQDRLVAYDIVSGTCAWLVEAHPIFSPAIGNDLVFLAEADALVALHAADGTDAWRLPMAEPLAARPVWGNGWLIGVTKAGTVLALRATDGHLVWRHDVGAAPHAPPAIAADRVFIATADSQIVALSLEDGAPIWERHVGGMANEMLALDDRLFAGSTDNFFYCLMTKDGRIDWRWRTGADVIGVPAADDQRVYFVSLDNVLRAMSQTSGNQQWMRALPVRPTSGPIIAGSTIVVSGQSSTIRAFDLKDGVASPDISASDEVTAPPHVLQQPVTNLPMILVVTRNIAKGDTAVLSVHTVEPTPTPVAPLPNPFKPGSTP